MHTHTGPNSDRSRHPLPCDRRSASDWSPGCRGNRQPSRADWSLRPADLTAPPFRDDVPVALSTVTKDDPRFKPCTPTANTFRVEWSAAPTAAQSLALMRVLGDLGQNRPNITLAEADPLIRAAVQNAH